MKTYTENYNLEKEDQDDFYTIETPNTNMEIIDELLKTLADTLANKLNASHYTATDVLSKLKGVDGIGSGLDADLLDGKQAADFLLASAYTALDVFNKVKSQDGAGSGLDADTVDGKEAADFLLKTMYTAADILTKLKTVDGAGSGLDADLLDGKQAADFLLASAYTALDVFNKVKSQDGADSGLDADTVDGKQATDFLLKTMYTATDVLNKLKDVDGAGSGLDADLLDGKQAADFLLASAYTALDVFNKVKTQDGADSGLDADTVDGKQAADFLLKTMYTAADILTKLKTVDGAGSGLDADLFRGMTPDEFINPFYMHLIDYVAQPANGGLTSGSSIVYACTSDPAPSELKDKIGVVITAHTASGSNPTLNWNGLGAKPIRKANGNPAMLSANGIYTLRYNASRQSFILQGEGASGNAMASDLLSGKTASTDAGDIVGTMPNRGNVGTVELTIQGSSYTIPEGYHNGIGKVRATLTGFSESTIKDGAVIGGYTGSFTRDGTANSQDILAGKVAYVKGAKITGEMPIRTGTWNIINAEINGNYLRLPIMYDGYYTTADRLQVLDSDWTPENIKSGVDIFGKVGTMAPLKSPIKYINPINAGVKRDAVPVPEGLSAYTDSYNIGIYNLNGILIRTIKHTYPSLFHHYDKYSNALIIYTSSIYQPFEIYDMNGSLLYSSSELIPKGSIKINGVGRSKNRYYVSWYDDNNFYVRVYDLNWTLLRTIIPSNGTYGMCSFVGFEDGIAMDYGMYNGGLWYFNEINTEYTEGEFKNIFGI